LHRAEIRVAPVARTGRVAAVDMHDLGVAESGRPARSAEAPALG
jgi:hypothetical protein